MVKITKERGWKTVQISGQGVVRQGREEVSNLGNDMTVRQEYKQ